jgi:signal transduction histidine kinase/CheY-like chemotaxis protein
MTRKDAIGPAAFIAAFVSVSLLTLHPEWIGLPVDYSRVVWFPSGLAVGVVLRYGARYVIWTFVAEFIVTIVSGDPMLFALGASAGNALEAGVAFLLLRRFGFHQTLERGRDVVTLIVGGAMVAAFAGALVSVAARSMFAPDAGATPFPRILAFWWLTHANGILLGVPVLLAWWHGSLDRVRKHGTEAVALAVVVVGLGFLLFEPSAGSGLSRRLLYVPFPLLIWSAFRFRLVGAAVANLLLALPVMALTALGRGPFNPVDGSTGPDALFQLWIFVAVNAVTALFVAAVVEEREREVTARLHAEEERRRMSERVARARRVESLGVLAGGVAHDFNNLLVSIMGHSELATRKLGREHPAHESVEEIMRASQRAAEICRQMLAYAGRGRVSNAPVDLADVASEMTELVAVSFDEATRVEVDVHGTARPVWGDVTQLRRVTLNLLTNAAAALPEGRGSVRISTGPIARHQLADEDLIAGTVPREGALVHLTVEDDGRGLDPDLRERIFEPFFTTRPTGRGLGLAAVLGIVVGHDGRLELRSEVGKGARFRIVLPVTDRTVEASLEEGDAAGSLEGAVVLVADDEPAVREVVSRLLREAGATVETVSDGVEAVRRFSHDPDRFDVVLLDLSMPGKGGVAALAELRAIRGDVPAVLMTGNVGGAERAEEIHGVPVLLKPFRLEDAIEALTAARSRPRAARVESPPR